MASLDKSHEARVAARDDYSRRLEPVIEPLLRFLARRVHQSDDAYDCLSEALIVLWKKRASAPKTSDEFRAWSYGIAKGVLANYLRAGRRRERLEHAAREALVVTYPDSQIPSDDAMQALASLPALDQELVTLIVWDGLGVAEAGSILGLHAAAARTRYSRARKRLRAAVFAGEQR